MLYQHDYGLSPALKKQLLWGRCINVHGYRGKNIPADLFMEHLNFIVKECIKGLGANQTEKGILRVSRALGTLECTRSVWSSHPSKLRKGSKPNS